MYQQELVACALASMAGQQCTTKSVCLFKGIATIAAAELVSGTHVTIFKAGCDLMAASATIDNNQIPAGALNLWPAVSLA